MKNEQSLLSCLLKKGELIKEIALEEKHFIELKHQKIFTAMKSLEEKNIHVDIITVLNELGNDSLLFGGHAYLAELFNMITHENNFKTYENFVLNDFKVRQTKELTNQIQAIHSSKDIGQIKDLVYQLTELMEEGEKNEFDLIDVLVEIEEFADSDFDGIQGVPTGFYKLDAITDGWKEEELIILAARPSVGKTAFVLELSKHALFKNHAVDFFSLEMSARSLLTRMICNIGQIKSGKMKNPKKFFNQQDWNHYKSTQTTISQMKDRFIIHDQSGLNIQTIRSKVNKSLKEIPDKKHLVIIDYLTLIQGTGRKERHLEVGEISRNLKRMARELQVPIIVLAQLNRSLEQRKDKRPMLSDLRDSGEIEQDADKVIFLHRDDYFSTDKSEEDVPVDVIIAKNRNGSLDTVKLTFKKNFQQFVSGPV